MTSANAVRDHRPREIQGSEYGTAVVQLTHVDLDEVATSQVFTWAELVAAHPTGASSVPANSHIIGAGVRRLTDVAGGSITTAVVNIGDAGNDDELLAAADVFTGAKATAPVTSKNGAYTLGTFEAAYSPIVTVTCSHNVSTATSGAMELYIEYRSISPDSQIAG